MRVAWKFATGYGILLLALVGLGGYHMSVIRASVAANQRLSVAVSGLNAGSIQQLQHLDRFEDALDKYRVTGDPEYLVVVRGSSEDFSRTLAGFGALALSTTERREVDRLAEQWQTVLDALEGALSSTLPGTVSPAPAGGRLPAGEGVPGQEGIGQGAVFTPHPIFQLLGLLPALQEQTRALNRVAQSSLSAELDRSVAVARRAEQISAAVAPLALLLAALIGWGFFRSISRSTRRLTAGTRAVARGEFEHRLDIRGNDEFAQLAADFNAMTERLGELDQAKRDFLSHVSHELRTPLSSMQEVNRLLLEGLPGELNARQRRFLEMNARSEERLSAMISKLLSLSRFDAGRMDYEFRSHELGGLASAALSQFQTRLHGGGVGLNLSLPRVSLRMECDRELLLTVLENLLDNAIKFSPEGGQVQLLLVHVAAVPEWVPEEQARKVTGISGGRGLALFAVTDQGPGIDDEEKRRVFQRFYQARNGRPKGKAGVGLGLALCQEIVTAHGGAVWVTDRPGGGSAFHVLLPGAEPVSGEEGEESAGHRSHLLEPLPFLSAEVVG